MSNERHTWGWKLATTPEDMRNFLNGIAPYKAPVRDAKLCATWAGSHLELLAFYQAGNPGAPPVANWGWKAATTPDDVKDFLNGTGGYPRSVSDFRVCGVWTGTYTEFFVFYRYGTPVPAPGSWGWKLATSPDDVLSFLNGTGAYHRPVSRAAIATVQKGQHTEFFTFYQQGDRGQPHDNWSWRPVSCSGDVLGMLNSPDGYPLPVRDGKLIAATRTPGGVQFHAFEPQGFLVITRPIFESALAEFVDWKSTRAFEVYLTTAEWIQATVPGGDLLLKMRNCIRKYHSDAAVRYAMLVGDSVDIADPQAPPEPVLSETWNLPVGYYSWDWGLQYTSLYYSDLTDKLVYPSNEHYWDGEYAICVGVVPVRAPDELQNVVAKTMRTSPMNHITFVYSSDLYMPESAAQFQAIKALAGNAVRVDQFVLGADASSQAVYSALFEQDGIVYEEGHGSMVEFNIGSTMIWRYDATRFEFINPLYVMSSCNTNDYFRGYSVDEAFLQAAKGPAAIATLFPTAEGFFRDLFAGRTIGQAFYEHCKGSWQNPHFVFGDPSQVIIGT